MKKVSWRLVLVLAVVIVAFIALGFVYGTGNKAQQEKEKVAATSETHGHQEGSAECIEAHKSGKCTGHEPGEHQPSAMDAANPGNGPVMNVENPGHGHEEGSPECIEAHKSGKCTGHEPGKPHGHSEKK